jgi:sirohydrochlorin ferrochelatase
LRDLRSLSIHAEVGDHQLYVGRPLTDVYNRTWCNPTEFVNVTRATDALVLVARESPAAAGVLGTHADRLRDRAVTDTVHSATWEEEPGRELHGVFEGIAADRTFVVPVRAAHARATTDGVPAAFGACMGEVVYCEPAGPSPAVTDAIADRAAEHVRPGPDAARLLVGLGSGDQPFERQAADYHATRLQQMTDYGEVTTAFLLQNPAVECARYAVTNDRVVAVPLPLVPSAATAEEMPRKLEVDRGGLSYAAPLADHPAVTDAIAARVAERRGGETDEPTASFEDELAREGQRLAADGDGRSL